MSIRSASSSDLDEIRNTLKQQGRPNADLTASEMKRFLVCRTEDPIDDRAAMLRTVAILPRHRLKTEGGEICGTVGFESHDSVALIRSLVVPSDQGRDTSGTRLLEKIEQKARQEGAERLYLYTTNPGYFEDRGYNRADPEAIPTPIATSTLADQCPPEATVMTKQIDPEGTATSEEPSAQPGVSSISLRHLVYTK